MVNTMPSKKLIVTLILAGVISACGYKAPVYLPTPEQQRELEAKEARIKARKEASKKKVSPAKISPNTNQELDTSVVQ